MYQSSDGESQQLQWHPYIQAIFVEVCTLNEIKGHGSYSRKVSNFRNISRPQCCYVSWPILLYFFPIGLKSKCKYIYWRSCCLYVTATLKLLLGAILNESESDRLNKDVTNSEWLKQWHIRPNMENHSRGLLPGSNVELFIGCCIRTCVYICENQSCLVYLPFLFFFLFLSREDILRDNPPGYAW